MNASGLVFFAIAGVLFVSAVFLIRAAHYWDGNVKKGEYSKDKNLEDALGDLAKVCLIFAIILAVTGVVMGGMGAWELASRSSKNVSSNPTSSY